MNSISYSDDMRRDVTMGRVLATSFAGLASFRTGNREWPSGRRWARPPRSPCRLPLQGRRGGRVCLAGQTTSQSISWIDRLKQKHLLDGLTVTALSYEGRRQK